ncbi:MAG: hypothetical protein ABIY70_09645 [Capsulimonas sp.]|uniref:hypothetical protein n=1 Tax=Capsulimonas sp. TaxID=2494211 RepID=UPI003265AF88
MAVSWKLVGSIILGAASMLSGRQETAASAAPLAKNVVVKASPFKLVSSRNETVTAATMASAEKAATHGVISRDKKTLTFTQKTIRLVVHTGPENDMLSYRINGLRNPTIVAPHGSTLRVLFVNNDGDMLHNVRFGAWRGSFKTGESSLIASSVGAAQLPHVDGAQLHAAAMVISAPKQPGKYSYFCTVRGHAPGGMWGVIQVR